MLRAQVPSEHFQPRIGQTTGDKYQDTGVTQDEFNAKLGMEETDTSNLTVAPGPPA
jgi:hypothetical protein